MLGFIVKLFVLVHKVRDVWEWLNCMHVYRYKWGRGCNVKVWFPECPLFGGKNTLQKHFGTKDNVRCSEFGGGCFSDVANVLQVWDFQSMTRALSALGSVSASWSVRSGRFYCIGLNMGVLIALTFSYSCSSTTPLNWSTRSLSFKVNRNEAEYFMQLTTQTLSYNYNKSTVCFI